MTYFIDERTGLLFAWGVVSKLDGQPHFDRNDLHHHESGLVEAAHGFMKLRERQRYAMQNHEHRVGDVAMVFPLTTPMMGKLGITSARSGLLVAIRADDQIAKKFETGEFTAVSYGTRIFEEHGEET